MSKLSVILFKRGKYEVNLPEGIASSLYDEFVKKAMEIDSKLRDLTPEVYNVSKREIALPVSADEIIGTEDSFDDTILYDEESDKQEDFISESVKEDKYTEITSSTGNTDTDERPVGTPLTKKDKCVYYRDPEYRAEDNEKYDTLGYKGFMLIRCAGCGKVNTFNAKSLRHNSKCAHCGGVTILHNLVYLNIDCPNCESHFVYRTNITDAEYTGECLQCGAEVDTFYHRKANCYYTCKD